MLPAQAGAAPPAAGRRCPRRRSGCVPAVGSISRSTSAAGRRLAAAGLADQRQRLALREREGTPSTARTVATSRAEQTLRGTESAWSAVDLEHSGHRAPHGMCRDRSRLRMPAGRPDATGCNAVRANGSGGAAARSPIGAARREGAAGRSRPSGRHGALDLGQAIATRRLPAGQPRHRAQQAARVGMARRCRTASSTSALLDDPARHTSRRRGRRSRRPRRGRG